MVGKENGESTGLSPDVPPLPRGQLTVAVARFGGSCL